MTNPEQTVKKAAPTCYRHHDRETYVSCGRCGKPLCPDCVMHGPAGIRCRECLLPQGKGTGSTLQANRVKSATTTAIAISLGWILLISVVGVFSGPYWTPNLLLSGVAGGMVGWLIWRICQRTWNTHTIRLAILLAIIIPLAATLLIAGVKIIHGEVAFLGVLSLFRVLCSIGVSVLMSWLLVTNNI